MELTYHPNFALVAHELFNSLLFFDIFHFSPIHRCYNSHKYLCQVQRWQCHLWFKECCKYFFSRICMSNVTEGRWSQWKNFTHERKIIFCKVVIKGKSESLAEWVYLPINIMCDWYKQGGGGGGQGQDVWLGVVKCLDAPPALYKVARWVGGGGG